MKGNKDSTQNSLNDIEQGITNKFKSIEIDMAMDLNQTIIKFLKDISTKIENQIKYLSNKTKIIKTEFKEEQDKCNQIRKQDLEDNSKKISLFEENIRIKINQIINAIFDSTSKNIYNNWVQDLSEYLSNVKIETCNNFDIPVSIIESLTFNCTSYLFNVKATKKNNWFKEVTDFLSLLNAIEFAQLHYNQRKFKDGINCKALSEFNVKQQLSSNCISIKEFFDKEINKKAEIKLLICTIQKGRDIKKNMHKKLNLAQINNDIRKEKILLKDLKDLLKETLELEIKSWEEPISDLSSSDKKLTAFLDLFRNLRYYEELENVEDVNE